MVGCASVSTARKRLALLGVPVVLFGRRAFVDPSRVALAIAASGQVEHRGREVVLGDRLPEGARLWDDAPRRVVDPGGRGRR